MNAQWCFQELGIERDATKNSDVRKLVRDLAALGALAWLYVIGLEDIATVIAVSIVPPRITTFILARSTCKALDRVPDFIVMAAGVMESVHAKDASRAE